jgi:hypothetical protein
MVPRFQDISIKRKLTAIIMIASTVALLRRIRFSGLCPAKCVSGKGWVCDGWRVQGGVWKKDWFLLSPSPVFSPPQERMSQRTIFVLRMTVRPIQSPEFLSGGGKFSFSLGRTPLTDGKKGLELVRILEASSQSLKQGGASVNLSGRENGNGWMPPIPEPAIRIPTVGIAKKKTSCRPVRLPKSEKTTAHNHPDRKSFDGDHRA